MGELSSLPEASKSEMDKLRCSFLPWDGGSPGDGEKCVQQPKWTERAFWRNTCTR